LEVAKYVKSYAMISGARLCIQEVDEMSNIEPFLQLKGPLRHLLFIETRGQQVMDTSPSLSEHQFNLGDTFGAFLISIIISSCLYGAACLQTWYYFRNYNDRILVRSSVLAILVLETLHTILSIHAVYYYVILNYDNPPALSTYI
ncbi:hypothetical protein MPER_01361, partial [Moniliophthora perniciosa FA553]